MGFKNFWLKMFEGRQNLTSKSLKFGGILKFSRLKFSKHRYQFTFSSNDFFKSASINTREVMENIMIDWINFFGFNPNLFKTWFQKRW